MLTKIFSASVQGIDAFTVTIETMVDKGIQFTIVGLPDAAVRESFQRVVSAIQESGYKFPHKRIVINLAPADVKKAGSGFDLPMAMGILASSHTVDNMENIDKIMAVGELSLDGSVLGVKGVLPIAIKAREEGFGKLIVPKANAKEAAIVNNIEVYGVDNLNEALKVVQGDDNILPVRVNTREEFFKGHLEFDYDFSEVKGQETVKRAFEIACAGGHNMLVIGSPGSGKSMMAKRLPSILPPLNMHEALETTKIHSVAGKIGRGGMLMTRRPFRSPHHTVSPVAMVGGGASPNPGEISLAHNGVLFLDEFPEFPRTVLEVLRQPMEDRVISVSRVNYTVDYPASFMLVASMNPCPCGYYGHPTRRCTCSEWQVQRYRNRLSGPLLDRIDIHVEAQPVEIDDLTDRAPGESSEIIRQRVVTAREIQARRYAAYPGIHCNAQMTSALMHQYAWPDAKDIEKLKQRLLKLNMSARAFDRILRVARTIADLDGCEQIQMKHISEAVGYRTLDRGSYGQTFT